MDSSVLDDIDIGQLTAGALGLVDVTWEEKETQFSTATTPPPSTSTHIHTPSNANSTTTRTTGGGGKRTRPVDPIDSKIAKELETLESDRKGPPFDPESRAWGDVVAAEMSGLDRDCAKRRRFKARLTSALAELYE